MKLTKKDYRRIIFQWALIVIIILWVVRACNKNNGNNIITNETTQNEK